MKTLPGGIFRHRKGKCRGADSRARLRTSARNRLTIKTYKPIASVAALSERLRQLQVIGRHRRPCNASKFVIARRPQADVAISHYPIGMWESHRRNRSCLPEIAPQGHFLALRAQGATAPSGPRNDNSEAFTILTTACTSREYRAGSGQPGPCNAPTEACRTKK